MAFAPHWRVSFGGRITNPGEPDEVWNCNVNATGAESDPQAALDDAKEGWRSWFANSFMATNSYLDYVKLNQIDSLGHYSNPGSTNVITFTPGVQGATTPAVPSILCIAISWTTARSRGPGSKGRIYPPNWSLAAAASMVVPATSIDALRTSGQNLLNLIHGMSSGSPGSAGVFTPVIASAVNGALEPITGIRVGNVLDVQRRRKNAYRELYSAEAFTPTN